MENGNFWEIFSMILASFLCLRNEPFPVRYQFPFTFTHVVQHHVRICGFPTTLSFFRGSSAADIFFAKCSLLPYTMFLLQRKSKFSKSCLDDVGTKLSPSFPLLIVLDNHPKGRIVYNALKWDFLSDF